LVPALNEAPTIGPVVEVLAQLRSCGLVDEVIVIDSGSSDRTREIASDRGASVVVDYEIMPELGPAKGKGEAMYKGLAVSKGDLVVWVDADVSDFDERFVVGLVGPLLVDPSIVFVKAFYARPLKAEMVGTEGQSLPVGLTGEGSASSGHVVGEGGRVTELTARPLLACLFPAVAQVTQPLSGEYAARRWLVEAIPFDTGYGVDVGILIDAVRVVGTDRIAECDLEVRHHRNRSLRELAPMAAEVAYAVLRRFPGMDSALAELSASGQSGPALLEPARTAQRPPLAQLRQA
jgi:glucosyl-3-phosphoglycerate synthase